MDYKNAKIYCLRSHQTDDVYYGSTATKLSKRLSGHKGKYKGYMNNTYHYVSSFEIIKYDDAYIELVETYPCDTLDELRKREGEIIRANKCVNKKNEGRDVKEAQKEYKEKHKERLSSKVLCECGSSIRFTNMSYHLKTIKHINYVNKLED